MKKESPQQKTPVLSKPFFPLFSQRRAELCVRSSHLLTFLILTYDKWCVLEELEACFIFLFHLLKHPRTQLLLPHAATLD